jgi:hypothetical protein
MCIAEGSIGNLSPILIAKWMLPLSLLQNSFHGFKQWISFELDIWEQLQQLPIGPLFEPIVKVFYQSIGELTHKFELVFFSCAPLETLDPNSAEVQPVADWAWKQIASEWADSINLDKDTLDLKTVVASKQPQLTMVENSQKETMLSYLTLADRLNGSDFPLSRICHKPINPRNYHLNDEVIHLVSDKRWRL